MPPFFLVPFSAMSSSSSGLAALLAAVECVSPQDLCSSSPKTDHKKKCADKVERKTRSAAAPELSTSAAAFRLCQVDTPPECGDAKALVAAVQSHTASIPHDTESSEFGSRLWRVVDPAVTISWNNLDGYRWTPAHFRDGVLEGLRAPPSILPLLAEPVKALVVAAIKASNLKHEHVKVPVDLARSLCSYSAGSTRFRWCMCT